MARKREVPPVQYKHRNFLHVSTLAKPVKWDQINLLNRLMMHIQQNK